MLSQTTPTDSSLRPKPISVDLVWDRVDPLAVDCAANPTTTGLAELPYYKLEGPGFERLVYELLQAENQRPWFFGRAGQADYGVDIVAERDGHQIVYQCKNYTEAPTFPDVRDAVAKFQSEWLSDMNLPAPEEFVYCCPHPLNDKAFVVKWIGFKEAFQKNTQVALSFLDRKTLDSKLRGLPDLVAGLFSDSYAEHFCGRDGWRDDPWFRLQHGPARFLGIDRFLNRHKGDAIYVDEGHKQCFIAALEQNGVVALRGLPGTGKTFLGLELACGLRQPMRRIYYATFKDSSSAERLWQSARRRLSLDALFVLDDCHLAPEAVGLVLERLGPELISGKLKLVLIVRDQVSETIDQVDDTPAWLARLREQGGLIELRADIERTLAVTCHIRPVFSGVSKPRLERLHDSCGGDLLLLDEILQALPALEDIDILQLDGVLSRVRTHYFGGNRRMPTLTKLAALAQFDLLPRALFFEGQWQEGEAESADPLMTRIFGPDRYQFLHSSLAALVLRALTQLEAGDEVVEDVVATVTASTLREYLLHLVEPTGDCAGFVLAFQQCLSARLHLLDDMSEARIKSSVLADKAIEAVLQRELQNLSFALLGSCVRCLATLEHPSKARYLEMIERRFRIQFEKEGSDSDSTGWETIRAGMYSLRRHDPERWDALLQRYGVQSFARLTFANSTLLEVVKVMAVAGPEFRVALLEQFTPAQTTALLDKTIVAGRSIGTLGLAIRSLRESDPESLVRLESAITASGVLRLILATGSLYEFLKTAQYVTSEFRLALLNELTAAKAATLLDKTIVAARSISTFGFAMRELRDTDPEILGRLEWVLTAPGFLRLILANGSLSDLFKLVQYATSEFRLALLEELTPARAAALLDKTIVARRSIGTLSFAMRELGETEPDLLERLERAVGAPGFLRLMLANGSVYDLFKVLEHATSDFRKALLEQLTPAQTATLIDRTIVAGRSIGTLSLAMRELGDTEPELLSRLERAVSAPGFLRLILANGSLFDMFKVLENATSELRVALVNQLTPVQAAGLVDKTIALKRSIGTFGFAMRKLLENEPTILARLERTIGAPDFLRLILANGTLFELFSVLAYATLNFRRALLNQITSAQAATLVDKTVATERKIEHVHFALRSLGTSPDELTRVQDLLGVEGWWKLFVASGSLNSISRITKVMSSGFRARMIAASVILSIADWREIIGRGFFLNACDFVKSDLPSFPQAAHDTFRAALMETAESLARSATWVDLNASRAPREPQNKEGSALRAALETRMEAVQIAQLYELEFVEAANAIGCCWRERPDLRVELVERLYEILPSRDSWPRKNGEVAAICSILSVARDIEFPEVEGQRLLMEVLSFLDRQVCDDIGTWALFHLIWNIAALSFERGMERSFEKTFSYGTQEVLLSVLLDRISPKGPNPEKLAQFALAGLLGFLFPQYEARLTKLLAPLRGAVHWLAEMAVQQDFVPAVFTLEGIAHQAVKESVFNPWVCSMLLLQYGTEQNEGPALKVLRLRISQKHN